jgi:hypothetical protein
LTWSCLDSFEGERSPGGKLPGELASEFETADAGQWGSSELEPDETEVRTGTSILGSIAGLV